MGLILCLETATAVCSVALVRNGSVIGHKESSAGNDHSATLTIFVEQVLSQTGLCLKDLDALAVSMGPGSYTGLRIGVSAAKGYCYALDIPLIAIPTLQAMAYGMKKLWEPKLQDNRPVLFCPMIDARRMEVYTALYDLDNVCIRPVEAEIITKDSFLPFLKDNILILSGSGAEKTESIFEEMPGMYFLKEFSHSAENFADLAEKKYIKKEFEDLAYFEPFYLKDFVAGKPRVKGL
ncbi:MAG: tRNA (adenosine(37)-N6)-threonylcarbamoyltransferase complex dimerization subunit type 1 TsaB [Bacteroidota bacterium]